MSKRSKSPTSRPPSRGSSPVMQAAASAKANFDKHREHDDAARQGMVDELNRIMKLIRDLKNENDELVERNRSDEVQNEAAKKRIEAIFATIRMILGTIKAACGEIETDEDEEPGMDGVSRLEKAVACLVEKLCTAGDDLPKLKQSVFIASEEVKQIRLEAEKWQRILDEATYRLREMVGDTRTNLNLIELIKRAQRVLETEGKAKVTAEKEYLADKQKMDEMLEERRSMLAALKVLFEHCKKIDRMMKEVGLKGMMPCPDKVDDNKSVAREFERAYGWLIDQVRLLIEQVRITKRRVAEAEERLNKIKANAQANAESLSKYDKNPMLEAQLLELRKQLEKESKRKEDTECAAQEMREQHAQEMEKWMKCHEGHKAEAEQQNRMYENHCAMIRQEMESLSKEVARGREHISQLNERIEAALEEYLAFKAKLEEAKNQWTNENRNREAAMRKLAADVAAMEAKAKEAEREACEYADDVREAQENLKKNSGRQDGDKRHLDAAEARRRQDCAELERLEEEEKELLEEVQSTERSLENRKQRHGDLQNSVTELETRITRLEKEYDELRYQSDGKGRLRFPRKCLHRVREEWVREISSLEKELQETVEKKRLLMVEATSKDEPALDEPPARSPPAEGPSPSRSSSVIRSRSRRSSQTSKSEDETPRVEEIPVPEPSSPARPSGIPRWNTLTRRALRSSSSKVSAESSYRRNSVTSMDAESSARRSSSANVEMESSARRSSGANLEAGSSTRRSSGADIELDVDANIILDSSESSSPTNKNA